MTTQLDTSIHVGVTGDQSSGESGEPMQSASARASGGWIPGVTSIVFGGDYNPEQWPREVWHEDVALMKTAGVNLVSIGIFSWALLEPREGEFDFGWLDDVIELLWDAGIGISLGTPTAAPPAWFWAKYPEARPVTRDGVALGGGSRGMASPSSPDYAAASARIVRELAVRYGAHPALRLWHVHNEYGAPVSESYSDDSVLAFREWLTMKYGTLDSLNAAWGTTFWGQHYEYWSEIDAPRRAASVVNPAQRLDFARFTNDALLACFIRERDILHEVSPGIPVTTNFMATSCPAIDYWKWAKEVDIVSNDHYLTGERGDSHILLALDADMVRSLAGGKPWLLMEHSTSAVNWQPRNVAKAAGELARNSLSHLARGADGIMFFQWRASRFGAEKFHSAMIPHAGPDSRIFRETVALGGELAALSELVGSTVTAKVAILWDWESFWAQDLEWRPSADLSHRRQIETFYSRLWNDGITTDFAHPESDLTGYDLVLAPSLYLLSEAGSANIRAYVEAGGTFVASYFSGIVDANDTVPAGASPGGLREVLGLRIEEFRPLRSGETVELDNGLIGSVWTDEIVLEGATTVAAYRTGASAGQPAVTRNRFGAGTAWYLSTEFDSEQLSSVLGDAMLEAGLVPRPDAGDGLEVVERRSADTVFTIAINHGDRDVTIAREPTVVVAAGAVSISRRPVDVLDS
jgi:beta-galactosidase